MTKKEACGVVFAEANSCGIFNITNDANKAMAWLEAKPACSSCKRNMKVSFHQQQQTSGVAAAAAYLRMITVL